MCYADYRQTIQARGPEMVENHLRLAIIAEREGQTEIAATQLLRAEEVEDAIGQLAIWPDEVAPFEVLHLWDQVMWGVRVLPDSKRHAASMHSVRCHVKGRTTTPLARFIVASVLYAIYEFVDQGGDDALRRAAASLVDLYGRCSYIPVPE